MIVGYLEGNDEHRARHLGARSTLIAQLAIDVCQLAGLRLLPHQAAVAWAADHVPSLSFASWPNAKVMISTGPYRQLERFRTII